MNFKKTGPFTIIFGKGNGRFPYVNSLVIETDKPTVIDPHSDKDFMVRFGEKYSDARIFHSHFHSDHIRYTEFFKDAIIHVHKEDAPVYKSIEALGKFTGVKELFGEEGLKMEERLFRFKMPPKVEFSDGEEFDCGETKFIVIHTPGHSPGHSCFYFPEEKFLYLADIDLTDFGPWYGNPSSNLEKFISSLEKVKMIDALYYLSAHETGFMDRETFLARFEKFSSHLNIREELILDYLKEPRTLEEIVEKRFIYKIKRNDSSDIWLAYAEKKMIEQHLKRLEKNNLIKEEKGRFFRI